MILRYNSNLRRFDYGFTCSIRAEEIAWRFGLVLTAFLLGKFVCVLIIQ